jgi:hypothetical protein
MALVEAGINHIASGLIGTAVTAYNAANTYIGVGDSSTAVATTQTDLVAATNKLRKLVTAGPTALTGSGTMVRTTTYTTSFGSSEANWNWQEWGVFNASSAGTMLCRSAGASLLGTKSAGSTWTVTVTLQFTGA